MTTSRGEPVPYHVVSTDDQFPVRIAVALSSGPVAVDPDSRDTGLIREHYDVRADCIGTIGPAR